MPNKAEFDFQIPSIKYDEISNGHPCEDCGLGCGCISGGEGKECTFCVYCDVTKTREARKHKLRLPTAKN